MSIDAPIYIFSPPVEENGVHAVHPKDVEENVTRLREYRVAASRIHLVQSAAELAKKLTTNKKTFLIIPGGYTPLLCKTLKIAYPAIRNAVEEGFLKGIWGQCAGANILCQEFAPQRKTNPIGQTLELIPVIADPDVFPVPKGAKNDFKIITIKSENGQTHSSFFNRGSKFSPLQTTSTTTPISPLAYYQGLEESVIATVSALHASGTLVIASGDHPEVVDVDVPGYSAEASRKILKNDQNRKKHVESIYKTLGIKPNPIPAKVPYHKTFNWVSFTFQRPTYLSAFSPMQNLPQTKIPMTPSLFSTQTRPTYTIPTRNFTSNLSYPQMRPPSSGYSNSTPLHKASNSFPHPLRAFPKMIRAVI